jgi:hypothetical protein
MSVLTDALSAPELALLGGSPAVARGLFARVPEPLRARVEVSAAALAAVDCTSDLRVVAVGYDDGSRPAGFATVAACLAGTPPALAFSALHRIAARAVGDPASPAYGPSPPDGHDDASRRERVFAAYAKLGLLITLMGSGTPPSSDASRACESASTFRKGAWMLWNGTKALWRHAGSTRALDDAQTRAAFPDEEAKRAALEAIDAASAALGDCSHAHANAHAHAHAHAHEHRHRPLEVAPMKARAVTTTGGVTGGGSRRQASCIAARFDPSRKCSTEASRLRTPGAYTRGELEGIWKKCRPEAVELARAGGIRSHDKRPSVDELCRTFASARTA